MSQALSPCRRTTRFEVLVPSAEVHPFGSFGPASRSRNRHFTRTIFHLGKSRNLLVRAADAPREMSNDG